MEQTGGSAILLAVEGSNNRVIRIIDIRCVMRRAEPTAQQLHKEWALTLPLLLAPVRVTRSENDVKQSVEDEIARLLSARQDVRQIRLHKTWNAEPVKCRHGCGNPMIIPLTIYKHELRECPNRPVKQVRRPWCWARACAVPAAGRASSGAALSHHVVAVVRAQCPLGCSITTLKVQWQLCAGRAAAQHARRLLAQTARVVWCRQKTSMRTARMTAQSASSSALWVVARRVMYQGD